MSITLFIVVLVCFYLFEFLIKKNNIFFKINASNKQHNHLKYGPSVYYLSVLIQHSEAMLWDAGAEPSCLGARVVLHPGRDARSWQG